MAKMSSTLAAESKQYAAKAKDLHRQVGRGCGWAAETWPLVGHTLGQQSPRARA